MFKININFKVYQFNFNISIIKSKSITIIQNLKSIIALKRLNLTNILET